MEQPRKLLLFFTLSLGFILLWNSLVMPFFLPKKPLADPAVAEQKDDKADPDKAGPAEQGEPADQGEPDKQGEPNAAAGQGDAKPVDDPANPAAAVTTIAEAEPTRVSLGSLDPESGYFLQVMIDSRGASIASVVLNDPRFQELDRSGPLKLIGDTPTNYRTFSTGVDVIDAVLSKQGKALEDWNWEHVAAEDEVTGGANSRVVFRVEIAGIEIRKTYQLKPVDGTSDTLPDLRKTALNGYLIDCALTFTNKGKQPQELTYRLQGPVGLRLENEEHARENRKIQVSFLGDDDSEDDSISAATIVDSAEDDALEVWKAPFRYVGVNNTYFAALLVADQSKSRTIGQVEPMVVDENVDSADLSDISLRLTSVPVSLVPGATQTHAFQLFAGPKRRELLDQPPLQASKVLNLGITGFIARWMLGLLGFFHNLGLPYGIAIICLTVLVRGCMFPLSRKQALSAAKMKELQPEIQALKDKYGDDKEKMAKAQMELFAKHKYNPFAGCLPLLFQFPIFIGLYTALYHSIDLRLAQFLWIDNLAAPDATFRLPFSIPLGLGQDFSILPIITVGLFLAQQKMFMPPPTSDEQAMQHKMMNFMTIAFGFFFWHSPAGLCLYFIASSLWGITERKLLGRVSEGQAAAEPAAESEVKATPRTALSRDNEKNGDRKPGFLQRKLQELAEAAAAANETNTQTRAAGERKGKKKKKRR